MPLLPYYRSYVTQMFVGAVFGLDASNLCRIIRALEPVLAKVTAIRKERRLSPQDVEALIVDATEQPCERPKKGQRRYYSGKKKRHTLKTQVRVTLKGRIVSVSRTAPDEKRIRRRLNRFGVRGHPVRFRLIPSHKTITDLSNWYIAVKPFLA